MTGGYTQRMSQTTELTKLEGGCLPRDGVCLEQCEHDSMFVLALFLGLPRFRFSVHIEYNTWKQKRAEKWEGLGTLIM